MPLHKLMSCVGLAVNVHIYPSPFINESRMLKITGFLERTERFEHIYILGTAENGLPEYENISPGRTVIRVRQELVGNSLISKIAGTIRWSFRVWSKVRKLQPSCINCHSLPVLPLCVSLKSVTGAKLIYDTHELETETVAAVGLRKVLGKLIERLLIRFVDEVGVVNEYIGNWYKQAYHLKRVWIVENLPTQYSRRLERTHRLHDKFLIPKDDQIFLYQGQFGPGRGIEIMLSAFSRVSPDKHLLLLGFGELTELIIHYASRFANIHFHPAVSPEVLPSYTEEVDVGLCVIENVCLSYYHCLPNKLFEYVSCGVPVIASDFPEMSRFIRRFGCGWCIEPGEESLAELVQGLDQKALIAARQKAIEASSQFCWEMEEPKLNALYDNLGFVPRYSSR